MNKKIVFIFLSLFLQGVLASCVEIERTCIESGETRNIEGLDVTLDCWKHRVVKKCVDQASGCEEQRNRGCVQIGAECVKKRDGICTVQKQIMKCPDGQCKPKNLPQFSKIFCLDGACTHPESEKNQDFQEVMSKLAALNASGEEITSKNSDHPVIFSGQVMECSKNVLGAKDCCNIVPSGWALALMRCDASEMSLARARLEERVIEVGEYCHNDPLGVCTSTHIVYCVFDSKIAKIIQLEGRKKQLGEGFGEVNDKRYQPNCRGITKEELMRLDFDKMDFSPLYKEISEKAAKDIPNQSNLNSKIPEKLLKQKQTQEKRNEDFSRMNNRVADKIGDFYGR